MIRTSTICAALLALALGSDAHAATPPPDAATGETIAGDELLFPESSYIRDLIERAQRALADLGLYDGPVNGVADPLLIEAIGRFQQRSGYPDKSIIDEALIGRLEASVNIESLLTRLARARAREMAEARAQLLSKPETRRLIENGDDSAARANRDTSACFAAPTPDCLLDEATESAKAVATEGRRDWALGEVLVAQVLTGLREDALATTGRISDPRLIIVALRRIAEAEAEAGRSAAAIDAIDLIPDPEEETAARVSIARMLSGRGDHEAALSAASPLFEHPAASEPSLASVLADGGRRAEADGLLVHEVLVSRKLADGEERDAAFRRIATAYITLGEADTALALLDEIALKSERNAVLIGAAASLAAKGRADEAVDLVSQVDGERYRTLALAGVAERLLEQDAIRAVALLGDAETLSETIGLPFAKDFALSRIAMIHAKAQARTGGDYAAPIRIAMSIGDATLRAETLWRLHLEHGIDVRAAAETATEQIAGAFNTAWLYADLADRLNASSASMGSDLSARALELAEKVTSPWARARLLARLAITVHRRQK